MPRKPRDSTLRRLRRLAAWARAMPLAAAAPPAPTSARAGVATSGFGAAYSRAAKAHCGVQIRLRHKPPKQPTQAVGAGLTAGPARSSADA
eukprot:scaffold27560_cov142-Isochrysis_galbana.AAC.5